MAQAQAEKGPTNRIGLTANDYSGEKSTLCVGCGHDSISRSILDAYFEMGIEPTSIGKMSGIGCSSKTPAYFISKGWGFNSTHGRMPSFATGAALANKELSMIGVSGDGDTMSIGLGQFLHLCRRNLNMTYVIENNGTYGLTKGQFSATADFGSPSKKGEKNEFVPLDPCLLAIASGATFVARSFSGDRKQLVPLLKAAIAHEGAAVIDVVSPCVTFNNHEGSTKSFNFVREHNQILQEIGFVPHFEEVAVDYAPGTSTEVKMPDGSTLYLKKLREGELDVTDKGSALKAVADSQGKGELITGLFYVNTKMPNLGALANTVKTPLGLLEEKDVRLSEDLFKKIMTTFM